MQVTSVRSLMRPLIGIAAFIQAIDMAILFHAVFDDDKMRLPLHDWLPVLAQPWADLFIGVWCLAALAFAVGWQVRLSGIVLVVSMMYAILVDAQTYSNHVYLLVIVILLLMLPGHIPLRLMRWQMSIVYFFAAISKVNIIYISGLIVAGNLQKGLLWQLPESLARWELMMPVAVGSIGLELFLALALWSPRYRPAALVIGPTFHLAIALLFPASATLQLIVFGITMVSLYLLFLDDEELASIVAGTRRSLSAPDRLGSI